jgi:hypothetical protein
MAKDSSLFTCLDEAKESKIYVIDDFSLGVVGQVDVTCRHGNVLGFICLSLRFLVIVCVFLCRGIKMYSILGIHLVISLEQVGLVFTT